MSKRSEKLFEYLHLMAQNANDAANQFADGLNDLTDTEQFAKRMKALESQGDEYTNSLFTLLNQTYITPIDREDYVELANAIDDIVDGLEACTVRFDLYAVHSATSFMHEFGKVLSASTVEVVEAIEKLQNKKLQEVPRHAMRLNELEKVGDTLLRSSLKALFAESHHEPLEVIKLKELYEILESVTDRCEDVGDVLYSIVVKNA